ncbi:folate transporter 1, chloroplastic [Medicago truncatula]|uniref:folate transporter 1, chloroplastic n=1 Tax=Medicago truncatula TaxID=3880 RepID=UPI001967B4D1|nr:folate transporter 1, chloroplastic [Medicago truncatula]
MNELQWEYPVASLTTGFAFITFQYPLDVVQTRLQVHDGRLFSQYPRYNNTTHAIFTIARKEGLKGLYAGFPAGLLGATISWSLLVFYYGIVKDRHARSKVEKSGALMTVCLCANPAFVVKTRLQLQTPLHHARPYSGLYDAFRTIKREEGFSAFYRGIVPGFFLISQAAIQFIVYEQLRKTVVNLKTKGSKIQHQKPDQILKSVDYAVLGATSKVAALLSLHPIHVIRTRLQQRPDSDGIPRYKNSWHVVKETARFEGVRGFYKGITPNLLKNVPISSIAYIVYGKVLKLLKSARGKD